MVEVETDNALQGNERETHVTFVGRDDYARLYSDHRGIITPLLKNDHFDIDWWRDPDGGKHEDPPGEDDTIVAISGLIPVGSLTVKGTRRSQDTPSGVVSTSEEVNF